MEETSKECDSTHEGLGAAGQGEGPGEGLGEGQGAVLHGGRDKSHGDKGSERREWVEGYPRGSVGVLSGA